MQKLQKKCLFNIKKRRSNYKQLEVLQVLKKKYKKNQKSQKHFNWQIKKWKKCRLITDWLFKDTQILLKIWEKPCGRHSIIWLPDKNPESERPESWWKWQRLKTVNQEASYQHPPAFYDEVAALIKPIYEELSSEDLLDRCLGANTQNNNGSFNSCVWNLVPQAHFYWQKNIRNCHHLLLHVFLMKVLSL